VEDGQSLIPLGYDSCMLRVFELDIVSGHISTMNMIEMLLAEVRQSRSGGMTSGVVVEEY